MIEKSSNKSQITVRIADYQNRKDAQAILGLLNHYACDPMGGGVGLSDYVLNNLIDQLQKHYGAFSVLAYSDNMAVGLVNNFQTFSTFNCRPVINIHDVIVRESHRGLKIAEKMLECVEIEAKERGCCKLTLEVLEGNESAKKVYQRFGFNAYVLDVNMGNAMFWQKVI